VEGRSGLYYRELDTAREGQRPMPAQLTDTEEFVRVSERAVECRVKRLKDVVKLKLRTPKELYTIKVDPEKAAEMLKQIRCEVIEA
jgi:large subunit ribosomal protein L38e